MGKVLIVYGTSEGQTRKISEYMREVLVIEGHRVHLWNSDRVPRALALDVYDHIFVGGSIHLNHFQRSLKRWVAENAETLAEKRAVFFPVCLGIIQNDPKIHRQEKEKVEDFFDQTGWYPSRWTFMAGALLYTKYSWWMKLIMRMYAKKAGASTDISHDYEYTNWNEVREFAEQVVSSPTVAERSLYDESPSL